MHTHTFSRIYTYIYVYLWICTCTHLPSRFGAPKMCPWQMFLIIYKHMYVYLWTYTCTHLPLWPRAPKRCLRQLSLKDVHTYIFISNNKYFYTSTFIISRSEKVSEAKISEDSRPLQWGFTESQHLPVVVAVCCSVLRCVAVCCSVLQCVAVCYRVLQCVAVRLHWVTALVWWCCGVL